MHKHIILFFSVLLFLTACGGDKTPDGIIPEPQMTSLLTDVHLADGALYTIPQVPDSLYKYGTAKYVAVFKKHRVTAQQFDKSFKYYTTQPEQLADIYNQIAANIKNKTDSLNKSNTPKTNNAIPAK
ncbi:hypothetical protein A0256_17160 [Mucilaginibacter sp. PAMC 26640]|nr:hypothetical protein A0256_17160 [Mucilaginibacter sp. PAMC 26640]